MISFTLLCIISVRGLLSRNTADARYSLLSDIARLPLISDKCLISTPNFSTICLQYAMFSEVISVTILTFTELLLNITYNFVISGTLIITDGPFLSIHILRSLLQFIANFSAIGIVSSP